MITTFETRRSLFPGPDRAAGEAAFPARAGYPDGCPGGLSPGLPLAARQHP